MAARRKKQEDANDGVLWRTKYTGPGAATGGTPIRISLRDLSVQRLLQCKQWFGESYGIPTEFLRLLAMNEAAAVMCAVWIGLQKAGRPADDARQLDFNLEDDFEALEDPQPPAEEKKDPPTEEGTASPSSD